MKHIKGQSLFEVLIALAISALIIGALVSLVSNSIRNTTFSKNQTIASRYAQETIEWLRTQRDADISTFVTNVQTTVWCLPELAFAQTGECTGDEYIFETKLLREVFFTTSDISGKTMINADVKITWEDAQGVHEVSSSTNFTDWRQR